MYKCQMGWERSQANNTFHNSLKRFFFCLKISCGNCNQASENCLIQTARNWRKKFKKVSEDGNISKDHWLQGLM